MSAKRPEYDGPRLSLPRNKALARKVRGQFEALDPETLNALLTDLEVQRPDDFIKKERIGILNGLHDIYLFPLDKGLPCAVVVQIAYTHLHVIAGVWAEARPSLEEVGPEAAVVVECRGRCRLSDDEGNEVLEFEAPEVPKDEE